MPTAICKTCGRHTNSTTSNYWPNEHKKEREATQCYAAWDDNENRWVKGCAYEKIAGFYKKWIDELIGKPLEQRPESLDQ